MSLLTVSGSPHIQSRETTRSVMWTVIIALMPAFLVGIYYFGMDALMITLTAVAACVVFEWAIQRFLIKGETTISDGSAIITGILLAFNLPSSTSLWVVVLGSLFAIGVGKMSFGGLGKNPFNPALVGRAFLFLSFPTQVAISEWPCPQPIFTSKITDVLTGPTPLMNLQSGDAVCAWNMFFGSTGGSFGEVSAIAIIIGGLYMLLRRVITWHIPVSYLGSAALFALILWLINPNEFINPIFHLLAGGIMLGAIFMATDMVTSPIYKSGQIVFGIGCGVLTILFRQFGPMPEGASFAILIMNALTPLINKAFKPKRFGYSKIKE